MEAKWMGFRDRRFLCVRRCLCRRHHLSGPLRRTPPTDGGRSDPAVSQHRSGHWRREDPLVKYSRPRGRALGRRRPTDQLGKHADFRWDDIRFERQCRPRLTYKMAQADKVFARWKGVLTHPLVPCKARLAMLPATVWSALLWSASTWNTTKAQRNHLASWSARVISKVAKVKRSPNMDAATYWRLVHRTGHILAARHGLAVVPRALHRVYSWAGHVARLSPKAPAAAALRCRGLQWWRWRQHQHAGHARDAFGSHAGRSSCPRSSAAKATQKTWLQTRAG